MKDERGFISIRKRMIVIFAVLITVTGIGIAGLFVAVFRYGYSSLSKVYLQDVNRQTTNNLENNIQKIEDMNVQILSSQVIQSQLRIVNEEKMDSYALAQCRQKIERELSNWALYASYVVSVSVISREGIEFAVKKVETGGTQFGFTEDEIYAANGTSLWGITGEKNRICVAKAILDLNTMKPAGYINIVYENSYFADILEDNSSQYSGASYMLNADERIMVSNRAEYVGTQFPVELELLRKSHDSRYDILDSTQAFYFVGNEMPNGWSLVQTVSVEEFSRDMNRLIAIAVIVVLAVLAISLGFVWYATSRIAYPARELMESMKTLAKDHKYPRVKVVSNDEIGMIGLEYNKMAENVETLIEKVYKMELTQKQAELEFLQMQINPHFLYNALDTISWMALGKGNVDVSEMAIALAELLRATIKKERFITLREEMNTVKDYLLIQQERFGEKISAEYFVEEEAYSCMVPNFILQPVIENAIIHGLEPKIEKGKVSIHISMPGERLNVLVEDNGVGMSKEEIQELYQQCQNQNTKQSIGLKNVYRRLLLCYGEESMLNIESEKGKGTRISFSIPRNRSKNN